MSCNYADGLSPYHDKGQLGLQEKFDSKTVITAKVEMLAKWIRKSSHVVIHTGAGISTSAGIPDFRGPKGVWTLQEKGIRPELSTDFNEAVPTPTHMAITRLVEQGKVKYVVSQNIDGLHLRSGLPRKYLSELHGNMFVEQCNACNRQFVRNSAVPTVGQKSLNKACPTIKPNGRVCRGRLHDTILDWEHNLPENDLAMADFHSCLADMSIALGTTMQIVPSGTLPTYTKKAGGKLIIINLQPTKHDSKADLIIHGYVDDVMAQLMKLLSMKIPKYSSKNDPTRLSLSSDKYFEWTISDNATQEMRKIYEAKCGSKEAKKRLEMIDDDDVPLMARVKKRKSDFSEELTPKGRIKKQPEAEIEVLEISRKSDSKRKRGRPTKFQPTVPPTKLTIKKNVTPNKTKYEIVPSRSESTRPSRKTCEIVHEKDNNACNDLEMICESDDDGPNDFTTNFRRYLYDEKTLKKEEKEEEKGAVTNENPTPENVVEGSDAIKDEEELKTEKEDANIPESTATDTAAQPTPMEQDASPIKPDPTTPPVAANDEKEIITVNETNAPNSDSPSYNNLNPDVSTASQDTVSDTVCTVTVNDTVDTSTVNDTVDKSTVNDTVDTCTLNDNVDKSTVNDTVDTSTVNDTVDTSTVNDTVDTSVMDVSETQGPDDPSTKGVSAEQVVAEIQDSKSVLNASPSESICV